MSPGSLPARCVPVSSIPLCFRICVCVFGFEPSSDSCSSVSNHPVVLVAVFLHKSPLPPHQRGFFCNDNSIKLTYKSSTVSNTALTAVGVTVPVVSVSPAAVRREEEREGATGPPRFFQWLAGDCGSDTAL